MAGVRHGRRRARRVLRARLERGGGPVPVAQPGARPVGDRAHRPRAADRHLDAAAAGAARRYPASRAPAMARGARARPARAVVGAVRGRVAHLHQPRRARADIAGTRLGSRQRAAVHRHVLRFAGADPRAARRTAPVRRRRNRGRVPVGIRGRFRCRSSSHHAAPVALLYDDSVDGAGDLSARADARRAGGAGPVHRRVVPAALARTPGMGDSWLETNGMVTAVNQTNQTRIERDPLGEMPVPAEALWGIQTERARQNFPISNLRPLPAFVDAVILIKKAAALTHRETGRLDPKLADAIVKAADEVLAGGHRDQFVVDPYQAGAGTSHNMNC